jgi:hypothetical protein
MERVCWLGVRSNRAKGQTVAQAPRNRETAGVSPFGSVPDSDEAGGRLDFVADLTVARRTYGAALVRLFFPLRRGGLFLPEEHPRNALFFTCSMVRGGAHLRRGMFPDRLALRPIVCPEG